ncbi:MAG TPA: RHS repeat-associated core domain-containing protein, partial [Thermoanaerobaculaceae bacterium]|nr:RHS repeat-associated core domain-containing protein [Thermoanaerobaculaceae bacterium]
MTESVTHAKRLAEVGEGVVDHQSLETASQMARPKQIWSDGATVPGTGADADWDSGSYVYDGAGNITAMGSQSFTYDKVSRLTFGNVAGYGSESYTYDPYGNLITSGGTSLPTATATNRLEPATTGAGYDAAGNLTALGLTPNVYAYTYDRFNQLASVSGPGINRSQATTADGERLFVRDGTTYLFTLRDLGGNVIRELEYTAAGGWKWRRDNIYRDSLLLASETRGEGLKHYHLDHLGSPRLVTNRTGEKLTLFATSPFGKDSSGSAQGTERMRFTVHERDLGSLTNVLDDIDYMHARSYTPRLGRFMSVDPVRGKARTPQSFNLHSYVRDRPMTSLDPNGMLAFVAAGGATAEDVAKAYEEQERLRKELSKALVKAYKE